MKGQAALLGMEGTSAWAARQGHCTAGTGAGQKPGLNCVSAALHPKSVQRDARGKVTQDNQGPGSPGDGNRAKVKRYKKAEGCGSPMPTN